MVMEQAICHWVTVAGVRIPALQKPLRIIDLQGFFNFQILISTCLFSKCTFKIYQFEASKPSLLCFGNLSRGNCEEIWKNSPSANST